MIFSKPLPFEEAIASRRVKSVLPTTASSAQLKQIAPELRERAMFSARTTNARYLEKINNLVTRIVSPETIVDPETGERRPARPGEYMDIASARLELKKALAAIGYQPDPDKRGGLQDLSSDIRLDTILETNVDMARGYGTWKQGQEPMILDLWPAQELCRQESRDEPRDWQTRWVQAGGKLYGGRMIALKNSPIWTAISEFGLPYPPFDYRSGMGVRDVRRDEAVKLGVIDENTQVVPEDREFNEDLHAEPRVRRGALLDALVESLKGMAKLVDGVLYLK